MQHTCGKIFHIHSEIDGKRGREECMPMYYNAGGYPCAKSCCKSATDKTASYAKEIQSGAPPVAEMER